MTASYTLSMGSDLRVMQIEGCFQGGDGHMLRTNLRGLGAQLEGVAAVRAGAPGEPVPLSLEGERVRLQEPLGGHCVRYRLSLPGAMMRVRRLGNRYGDALLLNAAGLLLRPVPLAPDTVVDVSFSVPEEVVVVTPWPFGGTRDRYRTDGSVFRYLSHVAIGNVQEVAVDVAEARLRLARLPGPLELELPELTDWLAGAAGVASGLDGTFPVSLAMVAVVPTRPGASPVAFGNVGRGGGNSVMLLLRENARPEALRREWVVPHEFSHLFHPFVRREELWLPEGLSTYYQEVLRARAGVQTEREAWQAMVDGFSRGEEQGTGRSLRDESRDVYQTVAFARVYWAGAAVLFKSDVALRRQGSSLDRALRTVQEQHRLLRRSWTAQELAQALDRSVGLPAVVPAMEAQLPLETFPAVAETLEFLGVRCDAEGRVVALDDTAQGAAIRQAIMGSIQASTEN